MATHTTDGRGRRGLNEWYWHIRYRWSKFLDRLVAGPDEPGWWTAPDEKDWFGLRARLYHRRRNHKERVYREEKMAQQETERQWAAKLAERGISVGPIAPHRDAYESYHDYIAAYQEYLDDYRRYLDDGR